MANDRSPSAPGWRRLVARWVVRTLAVVFLAAGGWYLYQSWLLKQELAEALAEADRLDPGWRLADIEARRAKVPEEENAALVVLELWRNPDVRKIHDVEAKHYEIFKAWQPPAQLNEQQRQVFSSELAKIPNELARARQLKDLPRGRFPRKGGDRLADRTIEEQIFGSTVGQWLQYDAYVLAQDKQFDAAAESCLAMLNATRALGDEPILISSLIQFAGNGRACRTLEWVLSQGELTEKSLSPLQVHFEQVAQQPLLIHGLRGERILRLQLFDDIQSGKKTLDELSAAYRGWTLSFTAPAHMRSLPLCLKQDNRLIELARKPIPEQVAALNGRLPSPPSHEVPWHEVIARAYERAFEFEWRHQAQMRSAVAALACERYRRKSGGWPKSLTDVVDAKLLTLVPEDPYDGRPLRCRRTEDGLVVYSIGKDMQDNEGVVAPKTLTEPADIGVRLWDLNRRRQSPPPPVELEPGPPPELKE